MYSDTGSIISELIIGLIIAFIIYSLPIFIYRFAVKKSAVPKEKAKKIAIIYAILSGLFSIILMEVLVGSARLGAIVFICYIVNYKVLVSGKNDEFDYLDDKERKLVDLQKKLCEDLLAALENKGSDKEVNNVEVYSALSTAYRIAVKGGADMPGADNAEIIILSWFMDKTVGDVSDKYEKNIEFLNKISEREKFYSRYAENGKIRKESLMFVENSINEQSYPDRLGTILCDCVFNNACIDDYEKAPVNINSIFESVEIAKTTRRCIELLNGFFNDIDKYKLSNVNMGSNKRIITEQKAYDTNDNSSSLRMQNYGNYGGYNYSAPMPEPKIRPSEKPKFRDTTLGKVVIIAAFIAIVGSIFWGLTMCSNSYDDDYYDSSQDQTVSADSSVEDDSEDGSLGLVADVDSKETAVPFTADVDVGTKVYVDIVSIVPRSGVYFQNSDEYTFFACRCKTAEGNTVWLYLDVNEYRTNFDSNVSASINNEYADEKYFDTRTVYGNVVYSDSMLKGLSNTAGEKMIRFYSVE